MEEAPGIPDVEVLRSAVADSAVLITADKDFGELVFRQGLINSGVLLIRLAGLAPESKADVTASVIENHHRELAANFTVITPGLVRIRKHEH